MICMICMICMIYSHLIIQICSSGQIGSRFPICMVQLLLPGGSLTICMICMIYRTCFLGRICTIHILHISLRQVGIQTIEIMIYLIYLSDVCVSKTTRFGSRIPWIPESICPRLQGFCGEMGWVEFLVVCLRYKISPNPRKNVCCGKKWPNLPLFNLIFVGRVWPWVGELVGLIIISICFPTQQHLVNRKHPYLTTHPCSIETLPAVAAIVAVSWRQGARRLYYEQAQAALGSPDQFCFQFVFLSHWGSLYCVVDVLSPPRLLQGVLNPLLPNALYACVVCFCFVSHSNSWDTVSVDYTTISKEVDEFVYTHQVSTVGHSRHA